MNFNVTQIEISPYRSANGLESHKVSAKVDGKRETLKVFPSVSEAIVFHSKVNAFVDGSYDSEVFDSLNAIAQARAEA